MIGFRHQNELILNAAGEGIYGLDQDGNLTFINPAAAKMLGWEVEELIGLTGQTAHAIVHHSKPDGTPYSLEECPMHAAFKEGISYKTDNEVLWRKDGTSFPVEYTSTPVWEDGKLVGAVVVFRDVTEHKLAEKTLRETLDQLSKKNRYESIISAVTQSVHRSINLQEVLENAAQAMRKNIDKVDRVAIYLVEGEEAVLRTPGGFPDWYVKSSRKIPYPGGLTWKTIIEGKPRYVADVDQDTVIGTPGRELGIKSYVSMPILFEGKAVGTVIIASLQKNTFNEDEIKLLEIVAQQIGMAINNAQKAEALRKALLEVEQLKNRLQAENIYLQEEIKTEYNFEEIVGQSASIKNVLRNVEKVAPTDTTILIQGETGTGKELIARAIHNLSHRRDRPLVKVNCGAISAGLVESELFGHEKGAFTGAVRQRIGRFELADGGTIFLDEVGELPLDTQVKLLRVLQEGEFERVGSSKSIRVDVRIIAATNRNLKEAVKTGSFRSDLFYRLSVFPLEVPSLRERKSDIPILANFFLIKFAKKMNKQLQGISKETMERLMSYPWPGNIRELQNVIERAIVLEQGPIIRIDKSVFGMDDDLQSSNSERLEDMERSHILRVLEKTDWVVEGKRGAALVLGLEPGTLRFRMKKLGIKRPGNSM
ncbi:MAG TPA: sigma 54-interacting transcriptional regulator [Thermodesulfobacteriota bacterium]|nr:sigma 54-interacting transcriptional regulator [Thermodesulfobacteriota bacterium]